MVIPVLLLLELYLLRETVRGLFSQQKFPFPCLMVLSKPASHLIQVTSWLASEAIPF